MLDSNCSIAEICGVSFLEDRLLRSITDRYLLIGSEHLDALRESHAEFNMKAMQTIYNQMLLSRMF